MSVSRNNVQLCSYCKAPGHKSDKCSCPTLLELLVNILKFVHSINVTSLSQAEVNGRFLTFCISKSQTKIQMLARNLNLIPNMSISLGVSITNLSRYILQERYIQNMRIEDEFINRISSRIGDRSELMVEYRSIPILLNTSNSLRTRRHANIAYQHTIGRLTNNQIRQEFMRDLHIVQRDRSLYETFMETYSGLRFPIDNVIISKYYVRMWVRCIRNIQPQLLSNEEEMQVPPLELVPIQEHIRVPSSPPRIYPQVNHRKVIIIESKTFVMPFECPICYEKPEGKCVVTLCEHKYCYKCFDEISNIFRTDDGHNHCPMCRSVLTQAICCEVMSLNDLVVDELN
jgi:hypothetical protein